LADRALAEIITDMIDADLVLPTTGEAQYLSIDEIVLAEYEIMLEDKFF
jgi:hypothetical protein